MKFVTRDDEAHLTASASGSRGEESSDVRRHRDTKQAAINHILERIGLRFGTSSGNLSKPRTPRERTLNSARVLGIFL